MGSGEDRSGYPVLSACRTYPPNIVVFIKSIKHIVNSNFFTMGIYSISNKIDGSKPFVFKQKDLVKNKFLGILLITSF
jgi:hypothetical protein